METGPNVTTAGDQLTVEILDETFRPVKSFTLGARFDDAALGRWIDTTGARQMRRADRSGLIEP